MSANISFTLITEHPAYYTDGYAIYFTTDTNDPDIANQSFGVGTKYLSQWHDKRFFAAPYHISTYTADGGVYIKIGIPYLD